MLPRSSGVQKRVPKRKDRVAPPPLPNGWDMRYATNEAIKGWEDLERAAPNNVRAMWDQLTANPCAVSDRQYQLKGRELRERLIDGVPLPQWQYKPTSSGRVWYCVDPKSQTLWLTLAGASHPKQTE